MNENKGLPEFTRCRLLGYAGILLQIADDYMEKEPEEDSQLSRTAMLRAYEDGRSRAILGSFMMDTAGHLEKLACMGFPDSDTRQRQRIKIEKKLKAEGILLHDYYRIQNRNGYEEIGMTVSSSDDYYDVTDVAELLSKMIHKNMVPTTDSRQYIHKDMVSICFCEEVRFDLLGGYAKATKDQEEVSGDNFLMREFDDGTYIAAIADGMGSGEAACESSEQVLELLERFLEAGLCVQDFRKACNGFLYMRRDLERSVTIDILECNRYTGEAVFYKNGGCSSFFVRGEKIKEINADKLALGVRMYACGSSETVFFDAGDCVVMLSDGVMDSYGQRKAMLREVLLAKRNSSPGEIATAILKNVIVGCQGKMPDDMTVLAIRITERDAF